MKLNIFFFTVFVKSIVSPGRFGVSATNNDFDCEPLPDFQFLLDTAFPPWKVDENENRIDGTGKWTPIYLTKRWDGLDAKLGGHPTDLDTRYPFYYAAPWLGQPGGGGNRHCDINAPDDFPIQTCPKIETKSDDSLYGTGHIPPHIVLSALRRAYKQICEKGHGYIADWFDFNSEFPCDFRSDKLLELVRLYYPRDPSTCLPTYPPPNQPGTPEYWELEFPSPSGSAHWCTEEYNNLNLNKDFCPYVYEGENRGKYRHPHLAVAALQQYLANKLNPAKCGSEWDDSNYPADPDHNIAFCEMQSEEQDAQPKLPYKWPEYGDYQIKEVPGLFLWTPPNPPVTCPCLGEKKKCVYRPDKNVCCDGFVCRDSAPWGYKCRKCLKRGSLCSRHDECCSKECKGKGRALTNNNNNERKHCA